jgi:pimeloyl-ACP methyl ester carboxylesterase
MTTTKRRFHWRRAASLAAVAFTLSTLDALPYAGASEPPPTVSWQPCETNPRAECGSLRVPVAPAQPGGEQLDLAVARRPATDPAARVGVLVYLPAGPGSSGVDAIADDQIFNLLFSPDLAARFDVVSFDPRGVGRSHPVECDAAVVSRLDRPTPTDQAQFDDLLKAQEAVGADCRRRTGSLFDHLDSTNAAHDVDLLRVALGESSLNLYALSYGTVIGQMYAERFPGRIRTMILDAVFDHSADSDRFAVTGALAAQEAFDQFVTWCEREQACVLHDADLRAVVADLFARAGSGLLTDPDNSSRKIDATELASRIVSPLAQPNLPAVAAAISRLAGSTQSQSGTTAPPAPNLVRLPVFIECADNTNRTTSFAHAEELRGMSRHVAPDVRESAFTIASLCINPPVPATNPQRPLNAPGAPPIVVMNARYDVSTPYQGAQRVAAQLDDAVLVTYDGLGHGAATRTQCTRDLAYRYLTERQLPARGTHCPST